MTFTLDTSGAVDHVMAPGCTETGLDFEWSDLSPFAQGYVEAMFATFRRDDIGHWPQDKHTREALRFDRLAPEALALILRDCERAHRRPGPYRGASQRRDWGAVLWAERQGGRESGFPPLTPYLGDDGKVHLREAGQ